MTQIGRTLMGTEYTYDGSVNEGLTIYFRTSRLRIKTWVIQIIRDEISRRSPVLMGANRQPLVRNSVGETLYQEHGISPQVMSYVLPLLVEEGFCTASPNRPFIIRAVRP